MNRRNPTSRNTPGRKSRSVTAFACDSASARSWRRIELALAASAIGFERLRAGQTYGSSKLAQLTDAKIASEIVEGTPRWFSGVFSQDKRIQDLVRDFILSNTSGRMGPLNSDAPDRHKTTRLRNEPTTLRADCLA